MSTEVISSHSAPAWGDEENARPVDPTSLHPLGELCATSPSGVDEAVTAADAALADWSRDHRRRAQAMLRWAERIDLHTDELADALVRQTGKPISEARMEVGGASEALRYNAGLCRHVGGRAGTLTDGNVMHVVRDAVGPTAFIAPWNWPVLLLLRDMSPALAAGVTAVVKPSPQTAIVTARIVELAHQCGIPEQALSVVIGDRRVGEALVRHPLIRAVSFTGSTEVGRQIMKTAADDLTRPLLELGGKGVAIVFGDSDIERACADIVASAFITAGQMCTACTRLLVARDCYPQVREAVVGATAALTVGNPHHGDTRVGPLITPGSADRVRGYIDRARHEATILTGGRTLHPQGLAGGFVEPTVITDIAAKSPVVQDDIFGPVLTIEPFDNEDHAVELANATPFGLAASVWTSDVGRAWRVSSGISAGTVWINGYNRSYPEMPSGGWKMSGLGRTRGIEGLEQFTEIKSLHFSVPR